MLVATLNISIKNEKFGKHYEKIKLINSNLKKIKTRETDSMHGCFEYKSLCTTKKICFWTSLSQILTFYADR